MPSEQPILVADIGGTHARFALSDGAGSFHDMRVMRCADFPDLAAAIEAYFEKISPEQRPTQGAIDVACPINGDHVVLTNRDWSFSIAGLSSRLGLSRLDVVNDFDAVARGIPFLSRDDFVRVGSGESVDGHPIAVLGPGTGLGVSVLVPHEGRWIPLAGEGGHVTLTAGDSAETKIVDALRRRFGHASAERALSGPGLVNLFLAIREISGMADRPVPTPSEITEQALRGTCPISMEAVAVFCRLLGTVASNLAITVNARGGVFLAGGILPRIIPYFRDSSFRQWFEEKGRFSEILKAIPTSVVVHPAPALLGLSHSINREPKSKHS